MDEKNKDNSVWAIFGLAVFLRLVAAWHSTGLYHPDEWYQVVEPARGLMGEPWQKAWEWTAGIRSFVPALFLAGPLSFARWIGFSSAETTQISARIFCALLSSGGVVLSYLFARTLLRPGFAIAFAVFLAAWPTLIFPQVHPLSETLTTPFVAAALLLLHSKRFASSGFLAGTAFALRFQSGFFGLSLTALVWFRNKKIRPALCFLTGLLVATLLMIVIDFFLWERPIVPAWNYLLYNVIDGGASRDFGVAPWHRYLSSFVRQFTLPGALILWVGWAASLRWRRAESFDLWALVLPFFVVHQLIGHKEDRFLFPIYPWLILIATMGWEKLLANRERLARVSLAVILLVCAVYRAATLQWVPVDQNQQPTTGSFLELRQNRTGDDSHRRKSPPYAKAPLPKE